MMTDDERSQVFNRLISDGIALRAAHEFVPAVRKFTDALNIDPTSRYARNLRGLVNYTIGDKHAALADLTSLVEEDHPGYLDFLYGRAILKMNSFFDDLGALEDFKKVHAINPNFKPFLTRLIEEIIYIIKDQGAEVRPCQ